MGWRTGKEAEYPRRDSNPRIWLRRPALYPLSYGGEMGKLYQLADGVARCREACGRPSETGDAPTSFTDGQRSTVRYLIRSIAVRVDCGDSWAQPGAQPGARARSQTCRRGDLTS